MDQIYEGFYARLETVDKQQGSMLMNADNLVGDDFEVFFKTENGNVVAWVCNKFKAEVGYFDADVSRKLRLANARDQTIRAILAYVAFSDDANSGSYWGQMALFCFSPRYADKMNAFVDRIALKIETGTCPIIDLGSKSVSKVLEEDAWIPNDTVPVPRNKAGVAVLKDRRMVSEKVIEQARAGNKGCYAVSIAFIVALVALVLILVLKLF